jgi:L-amino acid N-acyltransferase YncA
MLELGVRPPGRKATGVELRRLVPSDWPEVAAIYWDGIRSGLASFEVDVPSWDDWDAAHLSDLRLVAESAGEIVGWTALSPASSRRAYRGVVEESVYVADRWRGKGVGRKLLDAIVARSEAAGIWTIQTSIFPENRASVALHLRCGFRIVGVRERVAKRDGLWRDTLLLERRSGVVE